MLVQAKIIKLRNYGLNVCMTSEESYLKYCKPTLLHTFNFGNMALTYGVFR